MIITPYDKNFNLCQHWLYNTKNNIHNKEILNLQISFHGIKTSQIVKTFIRTIMKEDQEEILEDTLNCFATKLYSVYFTPITDIYYEQNRNIILITLHFPNFIEIHRPILCISLKDYSLDLNSRFRKNPLNEELLHKLTQEVDNFSHKPTINQYDEHNNYIKRLPLLELMRNKEYDRVANFAHNIILKEPYPFMLKKILVDTEYLSNKYNFKQLIIDDIKMFVNEKVLLARLAIIIYRLSFLEFDKNGSDIEEFFRQKLGLGNSKNMYLGSLNFLTRDLTSNTSHKAYDLRNLESKQIEIAKEIIKNQRMRYGDELDFEFDKESIYTVTHLSYEKIEQLIKKDLI
ncbi:hypothetical protein CPG37_08895 [Malaciobacter canalis]|uniref:Uncharacterized protein n=1 Tax=Malaciobacter canalis TaxID=1912871 RepID=A0ABX4LNX3_9BACT|nr:hypothetical protein [Malaciobacter canalis]PHO09607.1 hypothetical protein CPG37_08895 [Malaciobacter canalis]QEE31676.1 hypothetical protein ACAN_0140 [Malaciobacter canalis]